MLPQAIVDPFRDRRDARIAYLEQIEAKLRRENAALKAENSRLKGPSFWQQIEPAFVDLAIAINIITAIFFAFLFLIACLEFVCMMGLALLGIWVQWTLPMSPKYMTCPVYGYQVCYYGDTVAGAIYPARYGH